VFDQNLIEIDQTPIHPMLFSAALGTSDVTFQKFTFLWQSVKICSKLARHKFYLVYMFTCVIYSKKSNFHDSFPLKEIDPILISFGTNIPHTTGHLIV